MEWAPEGRGASRSQLADGTRCLPCSARGHFCAAHEIIGGRAVCLHCLDGVDCPRTPRNGVAVPRAMSVTRARIDEAAEGLAAAHTMPQPALASGAVPSPAMPPRRVYLQAAKMCLSCKRLNHSCVCACSRGCGKPRHRGACKGVVFSKAFPKATAAGLSNAEARVMVALAEEITAGVEDEVKQRGAKDGATVTERAKGIFGALEKEHAVFPVDSPVSVSSTPVAGVQVSAVATPTADEWTWVDMDAVPDYRKRSVYDDAVSRLRGAPVGKVMTKTFATADVAHTYVNGISRRAKDAGLVVGRTMEGSTIYLWRKA